ncbi:glycosyltransferase [Blastococcus sp. SYSU D01042]
MATDHKSTQGSDAISGPLSVAIVLKTAEGGTWILPHIDELLRRGHQVHVVLPGVDGRLRRALKSRFVQVHDSPFDFTFGPRVDVARGLFGLRRLLKAIDADVVMYHLYASALAVRLASPGLRWAKVHMVAGPLYLDSRVIGLVERALARIDTRIIAGSDYTAKRYGQIGIRSRVHAIPYGVDTEMFTPAGADERRSAREALGLPDDAFVAVMVAYFYAPKTMVHTGMGVKGHDLLLAAWERTLAQDPDARLVLAGGGFDGPGAEHRQELAEQFGHVRNVLWLDTTVDVRPVYAAADVSVSPSRSENHGAALEAGARGIPSIVSDAGGLPETVREGASGWVVPSDDVSALADALLDARACERAGRLAVMGREARALVADRFDSAKKAIEVVDQLEVASRCRRRSRRAGEATTR